MNNAEWITHGKAALLGNNARAPLVLVKGFGSRLWDADGTRYLDLAGGIAVTLVGHCHPRIVKVLSDQAGTLMHVSNLWYTDKAIAFAEALTHRTGLSKVYLCHSGAEANEALIKLARRYHYENKAPARTEIIATHNSFHGRTLGALSVTGQPKYHQGMQPLLPNVTFVPYNDIDAMRAAVTPQTAAVIVEPIQAEGGIIVPPSSYLADIRRLCDETGALMLVDEVQTGFGRTGKFLACEWSNIQPDAVSFAKGIGAGFPLGAMVVREPFIGGLPPGTHSSTQGGNPLAAAVGLEVLKMIDDEKLVEHAQATGEYLHGRLRSLQGYHPNKISEVRGKGLLQGLALAEGYEAAQVLAQLREHHVLASLAGSKVVRFTPSLLIDRDELDEGLAVVEKVFGAL